MILRAADECVRDVGVRSDVAADEGGDGDRLLRQVDDAIPDTEQSCSGQPRTGDHAVTVTPADLLDAVIHVNSARAAGVVAPTMFHLNNGVSMSLKFEPPSTVNRR